MGLMDNMKDKMSDSTNNHKGMDMEGLRARFEELRRKDEMGQADDREREEMSMIRSKIGM